MSYWHPCVNAPPPAPDAPVHLRETFTIMVPVAPPTLAVTSKSALVVGGLTT